MVTTPIDGMPAVPANGGTIGFHFETPDEIDAWHEVGLTSIEDGPGYREGAWASSILLIFAIRTATNCALSTARPRNGLSGLRPPSPATRTFDELDAGI